MKRASVNVRRPSKAMRRPRIRVVGGVALLMSAVLLPTAVRARSKEEVLYSFQHGSGGTLPLGNLILDKAGNLYGVAEQGGASNDGAVYKLTRGTGGHWTERVLYGFRGGSDGSSPQGSLMFDRAGNLYGTTYGGGNSSCFGGCGTVFELTPAENGPWSETILYTFTGGADGGLPKAGLVLDASGNFYGTTYAGGNPTCNGSSCGVVFELSPTNGRWTETVLYRFTGGNDGASPMGGVIADSRGNLYGTASLAGKYGGGTVFELAPAQGGQWIETVLHTFKGGRDGYFPAAGLVVHQAHHLYGTTYAGGGDGACGSGGCGTVFQLAPGAGGKWKETVLHRFDIKDGRESFATPVFDKAGHLYATAFEGGGMNNCGTAFELTPSAHGMWKDTVLHTFCAGSNDGATPEGSLVRDQTGHLYGVTGEGGMSDGGTVFEITP